MNQIWRSVKAYLRQNWVFVLIMSIGSVALLLQMSQVVPYADDYSLGVMSSGGIPAAFEHFIEHYNNWGGGYTAPLVILLFGMGNAAWQIILTLIMVLFVGLATKMICHKHSNHKPLVALALWCCVFLLSIWISRECIYWLDGGMAYLFAMFQAFLVFYFFYTRLIQNITKRYDIILIPLISFFGGWSSAQSGVISIIVAAAIIIWQRFVKKERVKSLYYISVLLCVIGFGIYYFAPGNNIRMAEFEEYSNLNLFEKVGYRIGRVTHLIFNNSDVGFTTAPIFLYLAAGLIALLDLNSCQKSKTTRLRLARLISAVYTLLFIFCFMLESLATPSISAAFKYMFTYTDLLDFQLGNPMDWLSLLPYLAVLLFIISTLFNSFWIGRKQSTPLLFVSLLAAYIGEYSMVLAPYSPLRTTFFTIAFSWIVIANALSLAQQERAYTLPIAIIIFTCYNFELGVAFLITFVALSYILSKSRHFSSELTQIILFMGFLTILAGVNYATVLVNYYHNRIINDANIAHILSIRDTYLETGTAPDIIILQSPHNVAYGFDGLAGADWIEQAVNNYFDLPTNLNLEYEEVSQ